MPDTKVNLDTENDEVGIVKIKDFGFYLDESLNFTELSHISYNLNIAPFPDNDWLDLTLTAEFRSDLKLNCFLSGRVSTRFYYKNLRRYTINNQLSVPEEVMTNLFSIAFGHTRAIMAKNVSGTKFDSIMLPMINPNEMLKLFYQKHQALTEEQNSL